MSANFTDARKILTISCPYEVVVNVGTVVVGVRETEPTMNGNRTHEAGWYAKVREGTRVDALRFC